MKWVIKMLQINQISCPIDSNVNNLEKFIAKKCHIKESDILSYRLIRQSLDARKELCYKVSVLLETPLEKKLLKKKNNDITLADEPKKISFHCHNFDERPIVIGFGPAGIFCALALAEAGCKPIVLERGKAVDQRVKDVEDFWKTGILNPHSNVQFGEGGAGTFSDGKLTTRVKDARISYILEKLVEAGADEKIIYQQHPHIGTDKLREIVKNIRNRIIELEGEIFFEHQVNELIIKNKQILGVKVNNKELMSSHVVLAIGHSAIDTLKTCYKQEIAMEAKDISIGVRIEHLQDWVNTVQYKEHVNHPSLASAEYRLTMKTSNQQGVYTFCMCPGGSVVAASSEHEKLVVNGMSESKRDNIFANSALLVQVKSIDKKDVFSSLNYIENLEKKAFELAKQSYQAPAQAAQDFLLNKTTTVLPQNSYSLGCTSINLHDLFDEDIIIALKEAILEFDKKMPGFSNGLLIALESRSSSPFRMLRNDELQSINVNGLYPCGEGVGYAGGIISSSLDGLRCAEAILNEYNNS